MADLNKDKKILTVKIVYYGPALSGKTTNLMKLHDILNPSKCGELMTLETTGDRTLFFDLLPLIIRSSSDFKIKLKLFTVPGQVAHDATRKAVLSRADGVVFVADSQNTQALNNFESFENLEKNTGRVGIDFDTLPLVVQFNKRDLTDIIEESEVKKRWGPTNLPVVFSSALYSKGVRKTFLKILGQVYHRLDTVYSISKNYEISENDFYNIAQQ